MSRRKEKSKKNFRTYRQQQRDQLGTWDRWARREAEKEGCAHVRDPSRACAPAANGIDGRISRDGEAPARSGQNETASCYVRPLRARFVSLGEAQVSSRR